MFLAAVIAVPPAVAEPDPSAWVAPADVPNKGVLFVNHEASGRSGHGNQALVQAANNEILAFYANTDPDVMDGHSNSGWSEIKRSVDFGATWSDGVTLEPTLEAYRSRDDRFLLVEEAVVTGKGTIIAFLGNYINSRWLRTTPEYILSKDNGASWSKPKPVVPGASIQEIGRTHAAIADGGILYCLFETGTHSSKGNGTGHKLYVSEDDGVSFTLRSALPFAEAAWYGTLGLLEDGGLIAYAYQDDDEINTLYSISTDKGRTWSEPKTTRFAKGLRNPQLSARLGGYYFMHGRSGHNTPERRNLVLYWSRDGVNWSDGLFLNVGSPRDSDSYSTNELIRGADGHPQLIVQASVAYDGNKKVNIHHWRIMPPGPSRSGKRSR